MEELPSVLARIDRLERDNRRLRRAGSLLLVGLAVALTVAFATPRTSAETPRVLRGEQLELTTPEGEVYARIFLNQGSPMLLLRKGEEKAHVLLTLNQPALHIRNADGLRGAFVGFDTRGLAKVELNGENLVDGVRLSMKPDGTAGVYALDSDGFDRAGLEYASDGTSTVSVRGERGKVRGSFAADAAGNSSLVLLDPEGRRRIGEVVLADGTPILSLEDHRARQRANLTMDFDGAPRLEFLREDGRVAQRIP